jgi:hypothetical protein
MIAIDVNYSRELIGWKEMVTDTLARILTKPLARVLCGGGPGRCTAMFAAARLAGS